MLVFSMALAELSWPVILSAKDGFRYTSVAASHLVSVRFLMFLVGLGLIRKLFVNFDPSSVAQFTDKKLASLKVNEKAVLSEPKLCAIVENAKQILKVIV